MTKLVFVAGATGSQGGAVVDVLLEKGHKVRALVRNPQSEKAVALASRGVELIEGNLAETEDVRRALDGADGAFLVTTPFETGVEGEVKMGRAMLDAAKAAGTGHVVLSSVADANRSTGIPHFESKYQVEQYAEELDLPVTVSAPVFFMENIFAPWSAEAVRSGKFVMGLPAEKPLQHVAVRNIGEFVGVLFERAEAVIGKRYDIAGDELPGSEMVRILSDTLGFDISYVEQPIEQVRAMGEDMALMYEWFDDSGYSADIDGLRREFPEVGWLRFADWAKTQRLDKAA